VVVLAAVSGLLAQTVPLLDNPDFEDAPLKWTTWPTESSSTVESDEAVAQHGQHSLRVTATRAGDRLFACAPLALFEAGKLYRISVWIRRDPQVPDRAIGFRINWRGEKDGTIKDRSSPAQVRLTREGEWTQRSGLFVASKLEPHAQFMLSVEDAVGRVWFDNITVEDLGTAETLQSDVWTNQTIGVEIGAGPLGRFQQHKQANDRWYQAGARYNALVFAAAFAERDLRDLQRCLGYAGKPADETMAARFKSCDETLNAAYLAYAKAFRSKEEADFAAFGAVADRLQGDLDGLRQDLAATLQALRPATPVTLPRELGRQARSVKPLEANGRMNRLLFGGWSPTPFSEWEEPFDLEFHSCAPGAPKVHTETELDFSNVTQACDDLQKLGYQGTFSMLSFGLHEYMYAPAWFVDKYKDEPDFFKLSADALPARRRDGNEQSLNYLHPAVRAYIKDYLGKYAAFGRNEPRLLFYETAQEAYPYFTTSKGLRESGYGPHGEAAFRQWLQAKYRDIAVLNREWGSTYADFAAVVPPPDAYVGRPAITPLVAEFEAFRDDAYLGYLKLIYDSLKAGDPTKPVVSRHSDLLSRINGARIFETCDILSYHRGSPQMDVGNLYLNSLNRFARRSLGYMEDFWGVQQEGDRAWDERAQRRGLEKHICRESIWGRTLQMKWYAYTAGAYLFEYNGNWFNPQYDLTTVRYCTPGLAIAKQQMEKLDWVLTHSQIAPAKVLVLQPSATMRNERPEMGAYSTLLDLHRGLYDLGVLYELVPEEYIQDGRASLSDYKVVVLPNAKYLAADLQRRLLEFGRGQGHLLILVGENGTFDELARPCDALRQGLGPEAPTQDLQRGIWYGKLGASQVCLIPALSGLVDYMDLPKLAMSCAPYPLQGYYRTENVLRVAENGDRYLFILNPDVDHGLETSVWLNGPIPPAVDVTAPGGFPVPVAFKDGVSTLKVRLGPGETAVIWIGR
jgi:hypothetical protein